MKLNPDCIRAVLLEIEKSWVLGTDAEENVIMEALCIDDLYTALPKFSREDIFYSLFNLDQAGFVKADILWADGGVAVDCYIEYMTYAGHQFLDGIRDPRTWSFIKSGLSAVRNFSLDAINALASGVTSGAVSAYLEKNPFTW